MSAFWSLFVIVLVVANIAGCVWLLLWTAKKVPGETAEGQAKEHVWDDTLREYNNPLPRWWLNLFLITVVFGVAYLALYPGFGSFAGALGWTSGKQHDEGRAVIAQQRHAVYAAFEGKDIATLAGDAAARRIGASLFASNCAGCHGADAHGALGFPNLADDDWLYGGTPDKIFESITNGRNGQMPAFNGVLSKEAVTALLAFVPHWSEAAPEVRDAGLKQFALTCAACHGPDGRGNPLLGAPNLTDHIWLHGSGDRIRETILFGRKSTMPSFRDTLSDTDRKLLAAFVYGLSRPAP